MNTIYLCNVFTTTMSPIAAREAMIISYVDIIIFVSFT